MPGFESVKAEKYVVELKAGYSLGNQSGRPESVSQGIKYMSGDNLSPGCSCLTEPFSRPGGPPPDDFDQMILFPHGSADNATALDPEIEFTLEDQSNSIDHHSRV
jgi:hypothetical protein